MSYPSNYKYGYIREDGYIFSGWKRRNGNVTPNFRNPKSFKQQDEAAKIRKQIKYCRHKEIENKIKTDRGCFYCGKHFKNNPEVFDWHHPDPSIKECDVSSINGSSYKQFERKKKEMEKCIVVCSNCHRIETKRIRDARN